ncbi:replication initiation protein [Roseomonas sp. HJA6]|uniref:Replication initiation protein n=1 Tax=Roseomonas alba TaxID=2846776 RepID=A0ABS7A5X5_9PROT|nr:replication initiation protein [Neoroseomonas alba]MBW6397485.1 replication initiation protein [Neoroseomonas alba]
MRADPDGADALLAHRRLSAQSRAAGRHAMQTADSRRRVHHGLTHGFYFPAGTVLGNPEWLREAITYLGFISDLHPVMRLLVARTSRGSRLRAGHQPDRLFIPGSKAEALNMEMVEGTPEMRGVLVVSSQHTLAAGTAQVEAMIRASGVPMPNVSVGHGDARGLHAPDLIYILKDPVNFAPSGRAKPQRKYRYVQRLLTAAFGFLDADPARSPNDMRFKNPTCPRLEAGVLTSRLYSLDELADLLAPFAPLARRPRLSPEELKARQSDSAYATAAKKRGGTLAAILAAMRAMRAAGEKITQPAVADRVGMTEGGVRPYWREALAILDGGTQDPTVRSAVIRQVPDRAATRPEPSAADAALTKRKASGRGRSGGSAPTPPAHPPALTSRPLARSVAPWSKEREKIKQSRRGRLAPAPSATGAPFARLAPLAHSAPSAATVLPSAASSAGWQPPRPVPPSATLAPPCPGSTAELLILPAAPRECARAQKQGTSTATGPSLLQRIAGQHYEVLMEARGAFVDVSRDDPDHLPDCGLRRKAGHEAGHSLDLARA